MALRWSSTYPAGIVGNNSSGSRQGHGAFGSRRAVPPHRPTVLRLATPSSELGFGPDSNVDSELDQGSDESVDSKGEHASEERTADQLHFKEDDESSGLESKQAVIVDARRASTDADSLTVGSRSGNASLRDLQGDSKERRQSVRLASYSALLVAENEATAGDTS